MALEDSVNPLAGISGPGKFAKRTDLQYQSPEYGAGVEYDAQKAGAPLAKSPDVRGATTTSVQSAAQDALTPLFAPSQRPNEPITAGIDMGAGPGSSALAMTKATTKLSDALAAMLPYDENGDIAILYQEALARGN